MVAPTREFGWAGVKLPTSDDRQNFDPCGTSICFSFAAPQCAGAVASTALRALGQKKTLKIMYYYYIHGDYIISMLWVFAFIGNHTFAKIVLELELVSRELNHLAAILHV